eukprot:CAMPEP_0113511154 /NCGR_PEP_ID=MMETSP0014_2-20120614/38544_1 /TAXON_ID=2857 /ORGANISM="Nitzschia sp." /LENGTH=57 /DNA_ID=CAMNT_0000407205 /DNA_START=177 /DNA_END=350 /DNA_ORIENTATION=+ /assembly_acc=CAM_ASM_000159
MNNTIACRDISINDLRKCTIDIACSTLVEAVGIPVVVAGGPAVLATGHLDDLLTDKI